MIINNPYVHQIMQLTTSHLKQSGLQASLFLFGSWARGEQRRTSDVDIAINFENGKLEEQQRQIATLRERLENSTIPYNVDVVHMNEADEQLNTHIHEEGILWIEPTNA